MKNKIRSIDELIISNKEVDSICTEFEINKPYEACGILIGMINGNTINVEKALPIKNIRRTRVSFELDPQQLYNAWNDAEKNGKDIVGIYHTHPNNSAIPSLWDRETMTITFAVWLIAGIDGMMAYIWDEGIKTVKLMIYGNTANVEKLKIGDISCQQNLLK